MLDPEVRQVIQQARDLIADLERWCAGFFALSVASVSSGLHQETAPSGPFAVKWCAAGAVRRAAGCWSLETEARCVLECAAERLYPDHAQGHPSAISPLVLVNDLLGHDAILAVFDKVLADETVA